MGRQPSENLWPERGSSVLEEELFRADSFRQQSIQICKDISYQIESETDYTNILHCIWLQFVVFITRPQLFKVRHGPAWTTWKPCWLVLKRKWMSNFVWPTLPSNGLTSHLTLLHACTYGMGGLELVQHTHSACRERELHISWNITWHLWVR